MEQHCSDNLIKSNIRFDLSGKAWAAIYSRLGNDASYKKGSEQYYKDVAVVTQIQMVEGLVGQSQFHDKSLVEAMTLIVKDVGLNEHDRMHVMRLYKVAQTAEADTRGILRNSIDPSIRNALPPLSLPSSQDSAFRKVSRN